MKPQRKYKLRQQLIDSLQDHPKLQPTAKFRIDERINIKQHILGALLDKLYKQG